MRRRAHSTSSSEAVSLLFLGLVVCGEGSRDDHSGSAGVGLAAVASGGALFQKADQAGQSTIHSFARASSTDKADGCGPLFKKSIEARGGRG